MKLVALNNTVIVEEANTEYSVSDSGIIFTEDYNNERLFTGEVLSSGRKDVNVGDIVVFKQWGAPMIKDGMKKYRVLNEENVLAIQYK